MSRWQSVCNAEELREGVGREAVVNGRPLALFLHRGEVYALDDRCPHREGQLSAGRVENGAALCPLHGWDFDLATGVSPYNPNDRVATYPARLRDGRVEVDAAAVAPLPAAAFDGYQGRWRRWAADTRGKAEVRRLAAGKPPLLEAMGAEPAPLAPGLGFDHFNLRAAQLARMPKLADEPVATTVVLGLGAGRPLRLALPVLIAHMSFGALSREAKVALAAGAARAGTAIGSGEGGMLAEERAAAGVYILEMASGYFGWHEEALRRADAFEIKIGQSAKPGLGGELPAAKVTAAIARTRGLAAGQAARSPARFPDIANADALGERIAALRERYPDTPIGIKIAANDVENDVAAACALRPDFITLDGFGGGTGAAPVHVRDHFGMPLVRALPRARRLIDAHNTASPLRPVSLVATGGIRTPLDVVKALALGADACAVATAALFALGCQYYRACGSGHCPTGIATQEEGLRARIDVSEGSRRVADYLTGTRRLLESWLRVMDRDSVQDLCLDDLIPLSAEAEALLGH